MIDIERKYGFWSGRVWGLILNLVGNTVALYGVSQLVRTGSGLGTLIIGCAISVACILVLARPS